MKKLAILTTHPIQYNAPFFQLLAQRQKIQIKVFYTWGKEALEEKYDEGFGKKITWDIPLLEGYDYTFLENIAVDKGSHHFKGIQNPTVIQEILAYEPDAILVFGWSYHSHLQVIRHFKGKIPIWFRGDSHLLDATSFHKKIARRVFLYWLYSHVDKAFFVGTNNKAYFKWVGLKEDQLVYAPHAIENERFLPTPQSQEEAQQWKKELAIQEDEFVWLFAGKFEEKKSPMLLLNAFIKRNRLKEHLIFIGSGHLEDQLKQKAIGNTQIHFLPFQNQSKMPISYLLADVFVLPSKGAGETWGLAINEAMAAQKAILASDKVGGSIDLIKESENGFVFQSENEIDLIQKMEKLATKEKATKMGVESGDLIQNFSFVRIAEAIENSFS